MTDDLPAPQKNPCTVRTHYDEWWAAVRPRNASTIQTEECRRAFYAGVHSMFTLAMEVSTLPGDEAGKQLRAIQHEIAAYFRTIVTPKN